MPPRPGTAFALAFVSAGTLGLAVAGRAAAAGELSFALGFTRTTPGAPTGLHLRATLPDRHGKPPVLGTVVYELPATATVRVVAGYRRPGS